MSGRRTDLDAARVVQRGLGQAGPTPDAEGLTWRAQLGTGSLIPEGSPEALRAHFARERERSAFTPRPGSPVWEPDDE